MSGHHRHRNYMPGFYPSPCSIIGRLQASARTNGHTQAEQLTQTHTCFQIHKYTLSYTWASTRTPTHKRKRTLYFFLPHYLPSLVGVSIIFLHSWYSIILYGALLFFHYLFSLCERASTVSLRNKCLRTNYISYF